ncbi:MAG: DUF692 domain-containing protein [Archangium sp.]|nr:DUF692 domain-containing protein [Archangium sp.]
MPAVSGVGIGLRRELFDPLLATARRVDWLEVITENFAGLSGRPAVLLERFRARWPLIPHGVGLSVGSAPPEGYLENLAPFVRLLDPPFFSDHLCFSSVGERTWFDLLPLPRHDETVARVVGHARAAQQAVGYPLVLENITTYAEMPGSVFDEATLLRRVAEEAGVGLLLDVNNLYVNAINHGKDPRELLEQFPLEHVRQLHLAGHSRDGELLLDTHAAPVAAPVWELYVAALKRCGPVPTLIEWDQHIPSLNAVLDEADRARALMDRHA